MTTIFPVLGQPAIEALGWALVHFLWQGAAVGVVLAAVLAAMRRWSSAARYAVCCAALAAMAVLPIATAVCCRPAPMMTLPLASTAAPIEAGGGPTRDQELDFVTATQVRIPETTGEMLFDPPGTAISGTAARTDAPALTTSNLVWHARLRALLPGCVAAWLCGVLLLSLRLLANWRRVQRMRRSGVESVPHDVMTVFERLVARLRIAQTVRLLQSTLVEVPTVIGWLKPVILLPASSLLGLSPLQLEAILIHELAHVRRWDYLINLLQNAVETLLFYHPAMWWVSARIREERENCCDDLAAALCGDRVGYAEALLRMEELRAPWAQVVVAVNGGNLLERIRRLLSAEERDRLPAWWQSPVFTLLVAAGLIAGLWNATSARATNAPAAGATESSDIAELAGVRESVKGAESSRLQLPETHDSAVVALAKDDATAPATKDKPQPAAIDQVTGTVVTAGDQPIVDFNVEAYRQTGRPAAEFVTDDRGEFRIQAAWFRDPLFAGEIYNCIARDSEGSLGWYQVMSPRTPFQIAEPEIPKSFRMAMLPAERTIRGRILGPEQQPLAGVRILVQRLRHPQNGDVFLYGYGMADELPLPSTTTDEAGRYELKLPKDTQITMEALHPAWVVRRLASIEQDDLGDVTLMPSARIAGRVIMAETGQPAPGIVVSANRQNAVRHRSMQRNRRGDDPDANLGTEGFCVTDAAGRFEIGGLKDDTYHMQVNAGPERRDLLGSRRQGIEVRTGEITAVDFTVQQGRRITGRVVEAGSGEPIPNRRVYVSVFENSDRKSLITSEYLKLSGRGEFECYVLPGFAQARVEASREESLKIIPESTIEFEIGERGIVPPVVLKLRAPTPSEVRRLKPQATLQFRATGDSLGGFAIDRAGETLATVGWHDEKDGGDAWRKGTARGELRLWNAKTGAEIAHFEEEFGGLFDVSISPDGNSLATAGRVLNSADDGELRIWDVPARKTRLVLKGHTRWVLGTTYSPDGRFLVSGSFDYTARIWDAETGKEIAALPHASTPNYLRFSRDGKVLAIGCRGGEIKLYETNTWTVRRALELKDCILFNIDLSPDGIFVAAAGAPYEADGKSVKGDTRGLIRVWNAASGEECRTWRTDGHSSSIAFSPDGRHLADARHTTSVWDVETGEELAAIFQHVSSSNDRISFSPDGKTLALSGPHGLQFWDVSPLSER